MDINNRFPNKTFGSATNVYFYTTDGKRILSDENIRKCERYLIKHVNYANNTPKRNIDLVHTLERDNKANVSDIDYSIMHVARSFYKFVKSQSAGFVTLITGNDVDVVNQEAKKIGKAKHLAKNLTGGTQSFETSYSANLYNLAAEKVAEKRGIYRSGGRQAFGILFNPILNKNGQLKKFEYVRSGYFDESKVK